MSDRSLNMALFAMYACHIQLFDYLKKVTAGHNLNLLRDGDPKDYEEFITKAHIAFSNQEHMDKEFLHFSHASAQTELTKRVVSKLFQTSSWPTHVLAYGYRKTRTFSNNGVRGLHGLDCYYPNTLHSFVTSRPWCLLLERIGDDVMMHLMLHAAVFVPASNGSWLQVCGPAASAAMKASSTTVPLTRTAGELKRAGALDDKSPAAKRAKLEQAVQAAAASPSGRKRARKKKGRKPPVWQVAPHSDVSVGPKDAFQDKGKSKKRMSSWLRRKLKNKQALLQGSEATGSQAQSSQTPHSHSEGSGTRRPTADRKAAKLARRPADDAQVPGGEVVPEELPGIELQTAAAEGRDLPGIAAVPADPVENVKSCGGQQCKGLPRYHSGYVINRSRVLYRAAMGDLNFSKSHILVRAPVSKRGADTLIRHVFGLCTKLPKRCATLPRRLVPLRKHFVQLLGRTRRCHMHSFLNKYCSPSPALTSAPALQIKDQCGSEGLASGPGDKAPTSQTEDIWAAYSQDSFVHSGPPRSQAMDGSLYYNEVLHSPDASSRTGIVRLHHAHTMPLDPSPSEAPMLRKSQSEPTRSADDKHSATEPEAAALGQSWADLLGRHVPHVHVARFVHAVLSYIVPQAMWGSTANQRLVYDRIGMFVRGGRYESLSMAMIMAGFKTGACGWAAGHGQEVQQQMVGAWLLWVFEELVAPLLQAFFYITEGSTSRHNLLYYLKRDWHAVWSRGMSSLTTSVLQRVSKEKLPHMLDSRTLTFSYSRLLPKPDGVRLIVNLSRRIGQTCDIEFGRMRHGTSINAYLANIFHILTFEKERKMRQCNTPTVMHTNILYDRLKPFVSTWRAKPSHMRPPIFVATADVRGAFDNIDQEQVLRLVRRLITEDDYWVRKYVAITVSHGRLRRQYRRQAVLTEDARSATEFGMDLSTELRKALIIDQIVYSYEERESLLKLLVEHVTANLVKIQGQLYVQRQGIPQGSVLSTLLCTLLLDKSDTKRLCPILATADHVLARLVDDYLLVTVDRAAAERFLAELELGNPEYGVTINSHKTQASFPLPSGCEGAHVASGEDGHWIPWCGILICAQTMNVRADYTRYAHIPLRDTITLAQHGAAGDNLAYRARTFLQNKTNLLFLDCSLNTTLNVCINIYQNGAVAAMRLIAYVAAMGPLSPPRPDFLTAVVEESVASYYESLRRRIHGPVGTKHKARFHLNKANVTWLLAAGMHRAFLRKQSRHRSVVKMLRRVLTSNVDVDNKKMQAVLEAATDPKHHRVLDDMIY